MIVHFMSLIALTIGLSQPQHVRIGTIEFFGMSGIDVQRVRSVLPMHEQDVLSEEQLPAIRNRLVKAIENAIGHAPTDVSLVCCNEQQNLMVYVGLGGNNTAKISFLPRRKARTACPGKPSVFTIKPWMLSKRQRRRVTLARTTRMGILSHITQPCVRSNSPCMNTR